MKFLATLLFLLLFAINVNGQEDVDRRIAELENRLEKAFDRINQLNQTVQLLQQDLARVNGRNSNMSDAAVTAAKSVVQENSTANHRATNSPEHVINERIIDPELGKDERENNFSAKPEIFIQTRYSVTPIRNTNEFEPNFSINRAEVRWAGKVSERLGAGLEIQFHPAIEGSPEELINDAFIEYYLNEYTTIRTGQFIKPFGFEIQQSSAMRESPERGIFAGYFFPGQRDRGVMLFGKLDFLGGAFKNVHYQIAALNGNRFFADNNRQLNYIVRARKLFVQPHLAIGFSMQQGKQNLPPGLFSINDEDIYGIDLQYAVGRFGFRGEFVAGNRPSSLLALEPDFASAFRDKAHSSGGYLFTTYQLTKNDSVYTRYDQLNGDPVTGRNVRAINFGYTRKIGELSRLNIDYQLKNRPSFNDDAVNAKLLLTWDIEF
ncbi:MAG: porin [Acidobacteriota bacterium]